MIDSKIYINTPNLGYDLKIFLSELPEETLVQFDTVEFPKEFEKPCLAVYSIYSKVYMDLYGYNPLYRKTYREEVSPGYGLYRPPFDLGKYFRSLVKKINKGLKKCEQDKKILDMVSHTFKLYKSCESYSDLDKYGLKLHGNAKPLSWTDFTKVSFKDIVDPKVYNKFRNIVLNKDFRFDSEYKHIPIY